MEFRQPGSENLSLIGSRTIETAMLFFDIDSGSCCNGRRYLSALNDCRQRTAALPSRGPPMFISRVYEKNIHTEPENHLHTYETAGVAYEQHFLVPSLRKLSFYFDRRIFVRVSPLASDPQGFVLDSRSVRTFPKLRFSSFRCTSFGIKVEF
ncbi:hypothetical protein EVAR_37410_1 [Eumeta japonica]|uniref:Uncharacterized protein n=1 Tax=Eumeta variegata TaxID=151549 RepID=A0A4C1WE29_EUMVA|nr:hypothetical protein EVAR_37410_1 [Eumeta japonica]